MLYFNSQKIPELQGLPFSQRMELIRKAADRLPTPQKVLLNILKLLILTPLFILIARSSGWEILGYVLLLLITYPLVTRPVTYHLCRPLLAKLRKDIALQESKT